MTNAVVQNHSPITSNSFSIRGYVAELRSRYPIFCDPFSLYRTRDGSIEPSRELDLSRLVVPEFRWCNCEGCPLGTMAKEGHYSATPYDDELIVPSDNFTDKLESTLECSSESHDDRNCSRLAVRVGDKKGKGKARVEDELIAPQTVELVSECKEHRVVEFHQKNIIAGFEDCEEEDDNFLIDQRKMPKLRLLSELLDLKETENDDAKPKKIIRNKNNPSFSDSEDESTEVIPLVKKRRNSFSDKIPIFGKRSNAKKIKVDHKICETSETNPVCTVKLCQKVQHSDRVNCTPRKGNVSADLSDKNPGNDETKQDVMYKKEQTRGVQDIDIPMDIVELMARNQYERNLSYPKDKERSFSTAENPMSKGRNVTFTEQMSSNHKLSGDFSGFNGNHVSVSSHPTFHQPQELGLNSELSGYKTRMGLVDLYSNEVIPAMNLLSLRHIKKPCTEEWRKPLHEKKCRISTIQESSHHMNVDIRERKGKGPTFHKGTKHSVKYPYGVAITHDGMTVFPNPTKEICAMNRNPSEFSDMEELRKYMIRPQDLRPREARRGKSFLRRTTKKREMIMNKMIELTGN